MGKLQKKPVKKKVVKNGRPIKKLDFEMIENLCGIQCTGEEIASILNVDYDTLNSRIKSKYKRSFSDYFRQKSSKGKMSLRRKQYQLALSGDRVMLIWLGKQYLGQSDKQENVNTNKNYDMNELTEKELDKQIGEYGKLK